MNDFNETIALDEDTLKLYRELGYSPIRLINGEIVSVSRFLFTWALMLGIDEKGCYRTRFCYENVTEAATAFVLWDGEGDPPGPWIKQKPENRVGPNSPIKFNEGS